MPARSIPEAREILEGLPSFARLSEPVKAAFLDSLLYKQGGLAHMSYGGLRAAGLSEADLMKIFELAGADMVDFAKKNNKFCRGSSGGFICATTPEEYCDNKFCSST